MPSWGLLQDGVQGTPLRWASATAYPECGVTAMRSTYLPLLEIHVASMKVVPGAGLTSPRTPHKAQRGTQQHSKAGGQH